MEQDLPAMRSIICVIRDNILCRVSWRICHTIGWEKINLTGDYRWEKSPPSVRIGFAIPVPRQLSPLLPLNVL